jgi:hypothetical protein
MIPRSILVDVRRQERIGLWLRHRVQAHLLPGGGRVTELPQYERAPGGTEWGSPVRDASQRESRRMGAGPLAFFIRSCYIAPCW